MANQGCPDNKMNRTRAWDAAHVAMDRAFHWTWPNTKPQQDLREAIDALVDQSLPIEAIGLIAEAVIAAYEAGKEVSQ